jgi:hypothetical protein
LCRCISKAQVQFLPFSIISKFLPFTIISRPIKDSKRYHSLCS